MRRLILIPFILAGITAFCQELSYKQFTVKDGLAGSIVYHALQDRNGFIWFATNQGVSRFDGRTFTSYTKENGLPDNEILKLYLDKYNNIWFISFLGIPSVLHNGKIICFEHCKNVVDVCEDQLTDSIFLIIHFNHSDTLFRGYYSSADHPGHWQFNDDFKSRPSGFWRSSILRTASKQSNFYFTNIGRRTYSLRLKNKHLTREYFFKEKSGDTFRSFSRRTFFCLTEDKSGIVFYDADSIYYCNFRKKQATVSLKMLELETTRYDDLNYLYCENDSALWICTRNRGLLRIKNFLSRQPVVQSFLGKSYCTSILKDRENGYWITTYNDGVYYLPNLCFHLLNANPDMINKNVLSLTAGSHNRLLAGYAEGQIIEINYNNFTSRYLPGWPADNNNNRIMDLSFYHGDSLAIASDKGVYLLAGEKARRLNGSATKELYIQSGGKILAGNSDNTTLLDNSTNRDTVIFPNRTTCITGINNRVYWGSLNGLYASVNGRVSSLAGQYPALSGHIRHIDIAPDSSLWVSTQQGIVILKNNTVIPVRKEQGILSNMCKQVLFDSNTAWVATDKGISRIDYRWDKSSLQYNISNTTEEDGLISNDVNQTILAGNYIWVATARGISFFPKNYNSRSELSPLINITKVVAGNEAMAATDTILINYHKSKLLIELSGISYRSGRQIYYEYRLKGLYNNWSSITGNTIEFAAVPAGTFVFEARAVDKWGKRSEHPRQMVIINHAPWWKTSWFLLLTYFIMATLVGTGFYIFHRNRRQKKEKEYRLKKKLHNLEMMALRAQMNPHFIFNCLTSIQYHIIRADVRNANIYLHKFSTLIRQTLQHSTDSSILLREEIKILELYLELEKLRLGDRMHYQVHLSENLQPYELHIPAMIIQPYVENAIKHGIAPLEDRQGLLLINIQRSGNYIECIIKDNGPGINTGKVNNSQGYTSMGTGITTSRINTINTLQKQKILLRVISKRETDHPDSGTIVHLSFPISTD